MMKPEEDRRVARTRDALKKAFVDLLLSKGYAAISVHDIAERANVGRSTFYMHFRSREDLLHACLARPSTPLADLVVGAGPETLEPLLAHFKEQRRRNRAIFESPARETWVKHLAGLIELRLARVRVRVRGAKPLLPAPLVAQHLAQTQIALVCNWLFAWHQVGADEFARALAAVTQAELAALLGASGYAASAAAVDGSS
jgi:AcrR family transcriptional regulator